MTARHAAPAPTDVPRWARLMATAVIMFVATVGPLSVAVTAHDVYVRDTSTATAHPFYGPTVQIDPGQVRDLRPTTSAF